MRIYFASVFALPFSLFIIDNTILKGEFVIDFSGTRLLR